MRGRALSLPRRASTFRQRARSKARGLSARFIACAPSAAPADFRRWPGFRAPLPPFPKGPWLAVGTRYRSPGPCPRAAGLPVQTPSYAEPAPFSIARQLTRSNTAWIKFIIFAGLQHAIATPTEWLIVPLSEGVIVTLAPVDRDLKFLTIKRATRIPRRRGIAGRIPCRGAGFRSGHALPLWFPAHSLLLKILLQTHPVITARSCTLTARVGNRQKQDCSG